MDLDQLEKNDFIDKKKIKLLNDFGLIKEMYEYYLSFYNYYILTNNIDIKLLENFNYYNSLFGMKCVVFESDTTTKLQLCSKIIFSLIKYNNKYYKAYGYNAIFSNNGKIRNFKYEFPFIISMSLCRYYDEIKVIENKGKNVSGELFFNFLYNSIELNKNYGKYIPNGFLFHFKNIYVNTHRKLDIILNS